METRELGISGALELTPTVHQDLRGSFHEWFKADELAAAGVGRFEVRQANCSVSSAGVLRGIHFADVPPGQAKLVTCLVGSVLDVVVDLRVGSPTFGAWRSTVLDDRTRRCVYLAEGLGHAFMSLDDGSVVGYLCSSPYDASREHSVNAMDSDVGVDWPTQDRRGRAMVPALSERDAEAPSLASALAAGLLPRFFSGR